MACAVIAAIVAGASAAAAWIGAQHGPVPYMLALGVPPTVAAVCLYRKFRGMRRDLDTLGGWMRQWERQKPMTSAPHVSNPEVGALCADFEHIADKMRSSIEQAEVLSQKDPLTGLPNRAHFKRIVEAELQRDPDGPSCLIFLDIDGFKNVNDTLGHHVGDELIKLAAERLRMTTRLNDYLSREDAGEVAVGQTRANVARLGGDEFTIFLPGVPTDAVARKIAMRLLRVMSEPFELGSRAIGVGASIGIAMAPRDGAKYADLLRAADTAMYHAKRTGRNRAEFYHSGLDEELRRSSRAEQDLREALAGGQFKLVYQPQFECRTLEIASAEALIRWHHPQRGVILPGEFIPIAEKANLINQIGEWVIAEAVRTIAAFHEAGLPIRISVNVSPNQLQQVDFVSTVKASLAAANAPPRLLELEITETVAMQNVDLVADRLSRIADIGVSVAVDDFGVGYSNLASLIRLPFSRIKLDRSLLQSLLQRPDARTLVQTIINMANSLGFHSVAEGVETREQLELLGAMGCDVAQGFLLSQPLSRDALWEMLIEQRTADLVNRNFTRAA